MKVSLLSTALLVSSMGFAATTQMTAPTPGMAPSTPGVATSVAEADLTKPKETKKLPIAVGALSFFNGPRANNPVSRSTTDDSLKAKTGLNTRHQLSMRYFLNKQWNIMPVMDFDFQLTDNDPKGTHARQFRWRDAFVRLNNTGLISHDFGVNHFVMPGDLRVYLPTSKGSRDADTIGGLRLSLNPGMTFGKSRFSLSAANYIRVWGQRKEDGNLPQFELYTGPQLNCAVSDHVNAFVLYEAVGRKLQSGGWAAKGTERSTMDLEPGMDFRLHQRLTLTPYLNWFVNQPLWTTTVNLNANITLL